MGSRGPVSLASVDYRHGRHAFTAIQRVTPSTPDKPDDLPEIESRKWDSLVRILEPAGLLCEADALTLELAVRHYGAARRAAQELSGAVTPDGRKHPASQVFRDHSNLYLEYAKQLGLSFVARARTSLPDAPDDPDNNPFD